MMSQQAVNSLRLFRGNLPGTIKKALYIMKPSVVKELKERFNAKDIDELALKISKE